jgi:hypothetical protein
MQRIGFDGIDHGSLAIAGEDKRDQSHDRAACHRRGNEQEVVACHD